jgi:dTDP-4-amino-4,6-dideoxygalactose transaminase
VVTGEGGIVLAREEADAARVKVLALHGMSKDAWHRFKDEGYLHYDVVEAGFKYNMMDLQAAIGLHQLARVETNWKRRQEIWDCYNCAFADLPVGLPPEPAPETRHSYHLYTIQVEEERCAIARDAFLEALTRENIGAGVHYLSLPELTYYRKTFGWSPNDYPHAAKLGRSTVSLPLSPKLSDSDLADVIAAVRKHIRPKTTSSMTSSISL